MASSASPSSTSASLGVSIVSHNTRDLLARCLASLSAETTSGGFVAEVWVVDNASTDGSADMVEAEHPYARVLRRTDNVGFAAANNLVLQRWLEDDAVPEWVMLLNPDTELRGGALRALADALAADPSAGIAGPMLVYPDGTFQHSAFRFPGLAQMLLDVFPVPRLYDTSLNGRYPRRRYEAGQPFTVDFPLGACMLARGEAVATVGALDDSFYMYCEEIDWGRRFRLAGYHNLCVPAAVVVHHGGASTRQAQSDMFVQLWRSRMRLYSKHLPAWRAGPTRRAIHAAFRARAFADGLAARRGRMSESERLANAAAYEAILAP